MDKPIKLNLCGKHFEVTKEVLFKSPFFKNMFDDCDIIQEIFLCRAPHIFKHVLALLIDGEYKYPKKYANELKYYLIEYDTNNFDGKQMSKPGEFRHDRFQIKKR